jgi:hypothetical protein
MPTIGNTMAGAGGNRATNQVVRAILISSWPANATVDSVDARIADSATTANWRAGVWRSSDGVLLGQSATVTGVAAASANVNFSGGDLTGLALTATTGYYVGVCSDAAVGCTTDYNGGAETYEGANALTESVPLSDATFAADTTRDYAIQITYTESGSSTPKTMLLLGVG